MNLAYSLFYRVLTGVFAESAAGDGIFHGFRNQKFVGGGKWSRGLSEWLYYDETGYISRDRMKERPCSGKTIS